MDIYDIYFSLSELLRSDTLQYTDQEYDSGRLGSTHSFGPIPRSFPVHCFLLDSYQHHECLQRLRLCTVSIPGWGTKNLMLHGQKNLKNPLKKKKSTCGHVEMATHSSILAWEIPWTEQPGGLRSLASQRVGHD